MSYEALALPKKYDAVKHPGDIVEAGSLAVSLNYVFLNVY